MPGPGKSSRLARETSRGAQPPLRPVESAPPRDRNASIADVTTLKPRAGAPTLHIGKHPDCVVKEGSEKLNHYACEKIVRDDRNPSQVAPLTGAPRSEEHTSELQSHSFISYAVFCL